MPQKPKQENAGGTIQRRMKGGNIPKRTVPTMEVRYRALVEQVPAVIYTDSAEVMFHTLYINPQVEMVTGYTRDEWMHEDDLWKKMILPEDRERVLEEYVRTYEAKQPSISEYRIKTRDGKIKWVSDETRLICDRKGKPLFWQGIMIDITARKRAEQVQQTIYRISHAVVTTASLDELYRSIHSILSELMPVQNIYIALYDEKKDLLSFPYYVDQYDEPPPPAKPTHGLTEYVLRTKKYLWAPPPVFYRLIMEGEVEPIGTDSVDWIGVPLMIGDRVIGALVSQSYTKGVVYTQENVDLMVFISNQVALAIEHKLDQQRIADALEYNRTLINSSSLGIRTYDESGQCVSANESIAKILGMTQEELLAENYNTTESWKNSGLLESAREAVTTGSETRREIQLINNLGKEIWLDCRITPFFSNEEPYLLVSADDITLPKQAEVELQVYAEKLEQSNRDLQEFAYIASHDLQEPLRKVLAFGDRLSNKYGSTLDETGRDYLKRMREASQRMQTLINDLLTFSRVSTRAQPFTNVDLALLVQNVISDLELQIDRTQGKVMVGDLPSIEADQTQLHQLLQNLINNGLKFHQKNRPPSVQISAKVMRNKCQISVTDNGIGFDMQYLNRIFKPFQRLHSRQEYEGSGMGLAICRRIVERHGGDITASSIIGEGSTFVVTLPIRQHNGERNNV